MIRTNKETIAKEAFYEEYSNSLSISELKVWNKEVSTLNVDTNTLASMFCDWITPTCKYSFELNSYIEININHTSWNAIVETIEDEWLVEYFTNLTDISVNIIIL